MVSIYMDANFCLKNQLVTLSGSRVGYRLGLHGTTKAVWRICFGQGQWHRCKFFKLFKSQLKSSFWSDKYLHWFPGFGTSKYLIFNRFAIYRG
jgi:hypothetical protein